MPKYEEQWEDLCDCERVAVIAIALELRRASGLEVRYQDVLNNSELRESQFGQAVRILEVKDLIKVRSSGTSMISTWLSICQ